MAIASGPVGPCLAGPVVDDVSNSITAHAQRINNNAQNYHSLGQCNPTNPQSYPSLLQNVNYPKTSRRFLHIAEHHIVLIMTNTGLGEAKQRWSDHLMYK